MVCRGVVLSPRRLNSSAATCSGRCTVTGNGGPHGDGFNAARSAPVASSLGASLFDRRRVAVGVRLPFKRPSVPIFLLRGRYLSIPICADALRPDLGPIRTADFALEDIVARGVFDFAHRAIRGVAAKASGPPGRKPSLCKARPQACPGSNAEPAAFHRSIASPSGQSG
jgi:hypothetical protein